MIHLVTAMHIYRYIYRCFKIWTDFAADQSVNLARLGAAHVAALQFVSSHIVCYTDIYIDTYMYTSAGLFLTDFASAPSVRLARLGPRGRGMAGFFICNIHLVTAIQIYR